MPVSIRALFSSVGLIPSSAVPWGEPVESRQPGVYVVSLTPDSDLLTGTQRVAPISLTGLQAVCSTFTVDGAETTACALAQRISEYWLADEVVLYIGRAARLRRRVRDFTRTELGDHGPHAGGYFVRALEPEVDLWIFYAECAEPARTEARMLAYFSAQSGGRVPVLPFANLEYRKPHGIRF